MVRPPAAVSAPADRPDRDLPGLQAGNSSAATSATRGRPRSTAGRAGDILQRLIRSRPAGRHSLACATLLLARIPAAILLDSVIGAISAATADIRNTVEQLEGRVYV